VYKTFEEACGPRRAVEPMKVMMKCEVLHSFDIKSGPDWTLTPWSSVFFEKLPVAQILKHFSIFYGARRFIPVFTRALQWSLL
jgi:hypothetical protein